MIGPALALALALSPEPSPPPAAAAPAPAEGASAAAPEDAAGEEVDTAPAGSEADRALWRDLRAATNRATLGMARVSQCSYRITYGKYYERLDALLKLGGEAEKARASAARQRLAAEATAAGDAVPRKPGVHECQYVLRDLGVYMSVASDPRAKRQLPEVRRLARGCVAKLAPLADRLEGRASALEGALAAIDALPPAAVPPAAEGAKP